jgi:hypothetical protein
MSDGQLRAIEKGRAGGNTPPPPHFRIGGRVLYDVADLDAWLEQRRVQPRPVKVRQLPIVGELVDPIQYAQAHRRGER